MAFYRNTVLIIVFSLGLTGLALGLGPDDSSPPELSVGNPLARLGQAIKGLGPEQDKLLPPDQAFQFSANVKDANTLHVDWQIAPGYYLYRERFKFALLDSPEVALGVIDLGHGQIKQEEDGPKEVFHDSASFDLPLKRNATGPVNIRLKAKYQGCAERGVCYSPMEKTVSLQLPATISTANTVLPTAKAELRPVTVAEQDRIADSLKNDSIWLVAASFFGFGLLMAFSPCIFPMIPILSGIIVGHGHKITTPRAFMLSLSYVLAASLAYTVFGVLAGLFGSNLQAVFQNPWVIGSFSGLFVVLALSMFGFYELQMPSFIQSRVTELSHKQKSGTLTGAAIMGALSALIVGPCMAAPLAGALIYIGQTGDALLGGLALFAMGLGMGVPLLAIGLSAGKLLPRAGVWMNAVRAVFGVGMLALAVWLLDRILPANVILFLWALLLIISAIFLNALDALPPGASGWRKLWKGVGVAMLAYGVLMLIGVANGSGDPLQPMRKTISVGECAENKTTPTTRFRRVATVAELQDALQTAQSEGRWAMLDFYADWCVSCQEMEKETFANPQVSQKLDKMVLLQADVTANADEDKALLKLYGLYGPPSTLFFGPDGAERKQYRVVGFKGPEEFLDHLQQTMR
ncbi:MAG: thiol:disulfide interchange protein [Candidatus Methylumidiphilus alinenensis]|uniref:Thiol:disulfide interchange protein DsbD n=1 Tax=Candidatus Methylumidiphilus alinenensis TaxID=2202197 RepID=A0A2W4RG74_9GAMM|nr:MAG: thiol:disulfide interchange protein [Candidatus Methylumidiphilus alinenensis]